MILLAKTPCVCSARTPPTTPSSLQEKTIQFFTSGWAVLAVVIEVIPPFRLPSYGIWITFLLGKPGVLVRKALVAEVCRSLHAWIVLRAKTAILVPARALLFHFNAL